MDRKGVKGWEEPSISADTVQSWLNQMSLGLAEEIITEFAGSVTCH